MTLGQRWCDEGITTANNEAGARSSGLDSCRLRHYGHMKGGPPIGGPPLSLPVSGVSPRGDAA